ARGLRILASRPKPAGPRGHLARTANHPHLSFVCERRTARLSRTARNPAPTARALVCLARTGALFRTKLPLGVAAYGEALTSDKMTPGRNIMERRDLLSIGGIAAIAGAFAAVESGAQEPTAGKRVLRIYADADGTSHIQELPIATKPGRTRRTGPAHVTEFSYAEYTS